MRAAPDAASALSRTHSMRDAPHCVTAAPPEVPPLQWARQQMRRAAQPDLRAMRRAGVSEKPLARSPGFGA